ncbi:MAG: hypothetical protein V7719_18165 [Psychroserpens sp.]|uniref:hypothetical protein n=1 Tax=Psychroserpens sp. TaxID=2020870 RepID=UPI003001530D
MIDKNKVIGFFGIGIFTYLSISNLTYRIGDISKDLFILLDLKPSWTFWLSELLGLILFIILINYVINWIYNNYESISNQVLKYFIWSFVAYFIIQGIQIVYPILKSELNNEGITKYYSYLKDNYMLYGVQSVLYYLGEIISIIIIYNKVKNGSQQRV